jgi:hypothetical protein
MYSANDVLTQRLADAKPGAELALQGFWPMLPAARGVALLAPVAATRRAVVGGAGMARSPPGARSWVQWYHSRGQVALESRSHP